MILPVVAYGHPILKKEAVDIEKGEMDLDSLIKDMFETMYNAHGVGLAAPQINKGIRLFIVDGEPMGDENESMEDFKKVFINPEILEEDGEEWGMEEGCLSIPDIHETVYRPERLKIRYFDEKWVEHEEEYEGMRARIIQHEYDHIEGVLFTDYLSSLKKRLLKKRLTNISKGKINPNYRMLFPGK